MSIVMIAALLLASCSQNSAPRDPEPETVSGYVVVSRHAIGLMESCGARSMVRMTIPAGLNADIGGKALLDAIYGRPMTYWPGYRVRVEGMLDRDTNTIVVTKVVEVRKTDAARNAKCEPIARTPERKSQ